MHSEHITVRLCAGVCVAGGWVGGRGLRRPVGRIVEWWEDRCMAPVCVRERERESARAVQASINLTW